MLARAFFVVLLLLSVSARAASSYQVDSGATVAITEHSVCAVVTNNHASGLALFVPTGSVGEWSAFRTSPGGGVTAVACDTTPDGFSFTDVTEAVPGTLTVSNSITIGGINAAVAVSVSGGEIRINGGSWGTSGTVNNGETLEVRVTSSGSNSTGVTATVTVGGVSDIWSVTTAAPAAGPSCPNGGTIAAIGSPLTISGTYSIARVNSTTVVAYMYATQELRTYSFNGSTWSAVGSAFSLGMPLEFFSALSDNKIVAQNNNSLLTFSWNGLSWSQEGSALPTTDMLQGPMVALNATTVAVMVYDGDWYGPYLSTYSWNGSGWEKTGNLKMLEQDDSTHMAALDSSTVMLAIGDGGVEFYTYTWDGTDWSLAGSSSVSSDSDTPVTGLGPNLVATFIYEDGPDKYKTYQWSGAAWSLVGTTVSGTGGADIEALDAIHFVGLSNSGVLQSYGITCAGMDLTPDAFSFTDQTGVAPSTAITSNSITISGIDGPVSVTATNGATFSINGGAFGTSGTIANGQTLALRLTASSSQGTAVMTTVTVGGASDIWSVTTSGSCAAISTIDSGGYYSCTLLSDGAAWCWGRNNRGQLGDGSTSTATSPVSVLAGAGPGFYKQISAGGDHTCGVGTNDKAYCWGYNIYGKLGDGTTTDRTSPVAVVAGGGPSSYKQISVGSSHTCGIGSDNKAYCWGRNYYGQLGNNATTDSPTPVAVLNGAGPGTYKYIGAGDFHTCAIGTDNKAYCWGGNNYYQLGDNTTITRPTPVLVLNGAGPGSYKQLDVAHDSYNCAVGTDDKAYCWGYGQDGEMGNGTTAHSHAPTAVSAGAGPSTYKQIASASHQSCGIGSDNKAYCWGRNAEGQLGDGTTTASTVPVAVLNGASPGTYKQVGAGSNYACAVGTDDRVYCWGYNAYSELGDGTTTNRQSPVTANCVAE